MMEIKERLANPPREFFPYILWRLEETTLPPNLPALLASLKNHCAGLILQASAKQKELVKTVCLSAKKEGIPIYLLLSPLSPFTSHLQATRMSAREGGMVELPVNGVPVWVGAISFQKPAQPTVIDLEQFIQNGVLRWSVPSGNWEVLLISSLPNEGKENAAEMARFWVEELAELTPPLSGFYIPRLELQAFPWREDFPDEFQRRRGYPLGPAFPSLALDLDEKSGKFRYDFRRTVYEIWKESIEGILYTIKRRGLTLFSAPSLREHCWGEILLLAPHFSSCVLQPSDNPYLDELAGTLLSSFPSLTHIEIKPSASPEEVKSQIDKFFCLGIGGTIFSLPWGSHPWSDLLFSHLASYQARISFLISSFPRNKKMAMLLPRLSLWSHQRLGEDDEYYRAIERDLFYLCELLHKIHYDFLLVDEDELPNIGPLQTVILPSVSTLKRSTLNWLERFHEAGGNVVALGMLPFRSEEGIDRNFQNIARSLFKLNIEEVNKLYLLSSTMGMGGGVTYAVGRIHPISQGKIYSYQPAVNPDRQEALRQTRQILRNCSPPDLDSLQEDILCHPRGNRLFLIFNRGEKAVKLSAMLPAQGIPFLLEPRTGESGKVMVYSLMEDGRIIVPVELGSRTLKVIFLEEGEELHIDQCNFAVEELKVEKDQVSVSGWHTTSEPPFVVIDYRGERKFVEGAPPPSLPPIPLPVEWEIKPEGPNVLPLKGWRFQRKTSWLSRFVPPKRLQESWPLLPSDYKPEGETWYQITFNIREMVEDVFLWCQYPPENIFLNGKRLRWQEEIPLREFLLEGLNCLTVLLNHHKYPFVPSILLKGDFSLYPSEEGWAIGKRKATLQIGSWAEQGFPFYIGTIAYITKFPFPSLYVGKKAILSLGQIKEMVDVEVNGRKLDFLFSPPWELEIGQALREGENELVLRITNCPPLHPGEQVRPSGLLAPSQILVFNKLSLRLPL